MTVRLDPVLATNEPDAEIQALLRNGPGRNLGVDFLPGALDLDVGTFAWRRGTRGCPASAERTGPRFRWLTAPDSTAVQPGPVHTGLTADPAAETQRLRERLVLR